LPKSGVGKRVWLPPFRRNVVGIETSSERTGNIVCMSGINGVSCGEVTSTSANKTSGDGVKLICQRLADYDSNPGDSGRPVYRRLSGRRALAVGINQDASDASRICYPSEPYTGT